LKTKLVQDSYHYYDYVTDCGFRVNPIFCLLHYGNV